MPISKITDLNEKAQRDIMNYAAELFQQLLDMSIPYTFLVEYDDSNGRFHDTTFIYLELFEGEGSFCVKIEPYQALQSCRALKQIRRYFNPTHVQQCFTHKRWRKVWN